MKKLFTFLFVFTISIVYVKAQQCVTCVNSTANGSQASVIGSNSSADGAGSVAIGSNVHTLTNANNSIVIGTAVQSVGALSFVIGCGTGNYMLSNYLQQSLMIGFNSNKPTLFVGRSDGYNKTGRIGIGNVTSPEAKLHIKADEGEEAAVFIEPASWAPKSKGILYLGTKQNSIQADYDYGLFFISAKNYLFQKGKVGIGTSNPVAELDVEGNIRIGAFAKDPGHQKIIFADQNGVLFTDNIPLYDNMGNCYAENDIVTNGHWIKHNEEDEEKGIFITEQDKIGIGTSMPRAALEVHSGSETYIIAFSETGSKAGYWAANKTFAYGLEVDKDGTGHITANLNAPQNVMNFYTNGKVSIGNARPKNGTSHRLFVEGGITTEEVVINVLDKNREWPDYVMQKDYELMPLDELKAFIQKNGHLPDVPTATEVGKNGLNVGEVNAALLEKIEQLTLYILQQQEEIEKLKQNNNE